jgi:hypothetical protein
MVKLRGQMRHISFLHLSRRGFASARRSKPVHNSDGSNMGVGRLQQLLNKIAAPFHRSIHVRFQYAFGLAVLGLLLMAVITIITSRAILDTYELSVNETRHEMMPIHELQMALREVDHLAYRYAIEEDQTAHFQFQGIAETVDTQLNLLEGVASRFASVGHAHSGISVSDTISAWREVKANIYKLFQYRSGTTQAIEALKSAHLAIDPVDDVISEFHSLSMLDLQTRLSSAQSAGRRAFSAMLSAIVVGMVLLIALGRMVAVRFSSPSGNFGKARKNSAKGTFLTRSIFATIRTSWVSLARRSTWPPPLFKSCTASWNGARPMTA